MRGARLFGGACALGVAALALGATSPAATPTPLVGNTAVEANADSDSAGVAEAFQATAGASGTATDMFVYVDSAAPTTIVAGVYADNAGHPGALLAQGTLSAPNAPGWSDVRLAKTFSVVSGTKYWLALLAPSGSGTVRFRDRKSSGASETSAAKTLGALPSAWQTGTRYADAFVSAYIASSGSADTTPPTAPTNFAVTATSATSASTAWTAASDNVGVAGYAVSLGGRQVGTTTSTTYTFSSLTCNTTYTAGVQAFDAAGNLSTAAQVAFTTSPCVDTGPPTAPPNFAVTSTTATSIGASWSSSTDDVGVAGYNTYLDGALDASVAGTSTVFDGLACGTAHTLGVAAYDAAGNVSARSTLTASTGACPDTAAPTVTLTAPAAGATVTGAATLSASATDDVGVASVRFLVDGAAVGPALTAPPFSWSWDSRTATNGTHRFAAVATDGAGNSATSAAITATVSNAFDTTNALKAVAVGPGFVDASTRDVIRTAADRVYMFVADDTAQRQGRGPGVLHAYRADQTGIPTSFSEVDALNRPTATGSTHVIGAPDVRLDRSNRAQLLYIDNTNNNVVYQTFSVLSDTWGPKEIVGTNGSPFTSYLLRVGNVALALDQNDVPQIVYSTGSSLVYRTRAGGAWSAPVTLASGGTPIHPQLALDSAGTLHLSWLQDGTSPTIHYKSRPAGGSWSADETVASGDVLSNSNSDQGPSIVVTSTGVPYVLYVSAQKAYVNSVYGAERLAYRTSTGWKIDATPTDLLAHTPQIYGQGADLYGFLGHDTSIHFGYSWQDGGPAGPWSGYSTLYSGATVDGSASIRWDPQRETNAGVIDVGFFDEDINDDKAYLPRAYYIAVLPRGGQPQQPPDTTAPSVTVTAPANGSTVSGTVTVTATASDNVGVAGVQFMLDGSALGTEDTTAPYSVSWNAGTATPGTHQLTAVARDAAGNRTTSAAVAVTVAAPADTTPPTVAITAPAAGATVSGTVTVTANASDNASVSSVRFSVDGTSLGTSTASPYRVSWDSTKVSDGTHTLAATATDSSGNTNTASISVVVQNGAAPAGVTVTKIMEASDTDRQVHTFTLPKGVAAGHTILLAHASTIGESDGGIVTPNGVSDSSGNTWHQDAVSHVTSSYTTVEVWTATVTTALPTGATLTIKGYARGLSDEFGLFDITGIGAVDKSASSAGYGVYNTPSIATATAHELLVGVHAQSSATAPWWTPESVTPAWVELVDRFDGGNISRGIAVQFREIKTAGSYRSGGTAKQTVTANNLVVAYRAG